MRVKIQELTGIGILEWDEEPAKQKAKRKAAA